jgi:hypothetical protein
LILKLEYKDLTNTKTNLPNGAFAYKEEINDPFGKEINQVIVSNGALRFSVILERGMNIGELYLKEQKVSWDRERKFLLHPANVDLAKNNGTGWMDGFFPAVASIGPELFGTPGEGLTLHGTSSYSPAVLDSVRITADDTYIVVEGLVPVKGYESKPAFEKKVKRITAYNSAAVLIEESTKNVSTSERVVDDGHHIQLYSSYLENGGRYVLPVATKHLLLRDSAPKENDPLNIPALEEGPQPIRCYQYVPHAVDGLEDLEPIKQYYNLLLKEKGLTAEMIMDNGSNFAGYVIRPLECFPRSLIAKEIADTAMFALEPCRTRPNRMSQIITDGEAIYLKPQEELVTQCLIGVSFEKEVIMSLAKAIEEKMYA